MNTDMSQDSYVVAGPGGFYNEACNWFGYTKSHHVLVVKFSVWNDWYNCARFSKHRIVPPRPEFIAETWEEATAKRDELNNA